MELIRRIAPGRLSEIFGTRTIEIDKRQLRTDIARAAQVAVDSWQNFPKALDLFENYTDRGDQFKPKISEITNKKP